MKQQSKRGWTYRLGLIALASLVIGAVPAYSGQQSGRQMSGGQSDQQMQQGQQQQGQQAQQGQAQQRESRYQEGGNWQKVSGFVKKMRKYDVGNGEEQNLVVQIQTDQGRHQTIDLGNAEDLEDFEIDRGDRITAWGKIRKISGREVLLAKKLRINGEKVTINRPAFSQSRQQAKQQGDENLAEQGRGSEGESLKKIRGEVVGAGEVVTYERKGDLMEADRDAYYIVEEPDGRQSHILVGERLDPWLHVGDSIEATVAPDGHVVTIASGAGVFPGESGMQQSRRGSQDQGTRQDQFSREQQSGQQPSQDQLSRQEQSGQQREQTARQPQDER